MVKQIHVHMYMCICTYIQGMCIQVHGKAKDIFACTHIYKCLYVDVYKRCKINSILVAHESRGNSHVHMCTCAHVCMYMCARTYVYVHIIYVQMYIFIMYICTYVYV